MSPQQQRALLGVAIFMCAVISGDRIYKFYESTQPLAQPGECLSLPDPNYGPLKTRVVSNDDSIKTTYGIVELNNFMPGVKLEIPIKATYKELRDLGVTKVSCE